MRIGVALSLVLLLSACGSSNAKPETPLHVSTFELKSTLLGKQLDQVLVTPQGGGKGRPLIVFLHGYGGTPADTLSPALVAALRRLGDRAPAVVLPDGQVGWWHDRDEGRWGSYVLDEVIPTALARTGADAHRVAVGGISMGGFGALNLGRHRDRFCAIGGHSPALWFSGADSAPGAFDDAEDYARHDIFNHPPHYSAPVWIDVGTDDPFRNAAVHYAHEIHAQLHVWPGGHDSDYWRSHMGQYLAFYARHCS